MHRSLALCCSALALTACSSVSTSSDAADVAVTDADATAADVSADDVNDAALESAVDVVPDAGSFAGRWRMVGADFTTSSGTSVHLTDVNSLIPGTSAQGRCNGLLTLEDNRVALAFGILANDHFLVTQDAANYEGVIAASGVTAAGTLSGTSFAPAGGGTPITWTANADGTLTQVGTNGSLITWARAGSLVSMSGLITSGLVAIHRPATSQPMLHPRMALAWDNAGSTGFTTSNDVPLTFGAMGYSTFNLSVVSIPPAALADIGGTQVALAYVIVYDDRDASGSFHRATGDAGAGDDLRGFSPVGIAYRSDATPSTAFTLSALRDLNGGYQFVNVHIDFASSAAGISPFDPTHVVTPDVAVAVAPITAQIPDIVP